MSTLEHLQKAQETLAKRRAEGEVIVSLNPWQKWQQKDTRLTAVRAFCWHCTGGSADESEGVRETIRSCTAGPKSSQPCPLFNWRPYK